MTDKELLQEALDALTYVGDKEIYSDTIDALRARLSQPEPEPVAWGLQQQFEGKIGTAPVAFKRHDEFGFVVPLYTAPPQLDVPETAFGKMPETINMENFVGSGKPLVPVAWISCNAGLYHGKPDESLKPLPLYTTPPQREWVGLTGEELQEIYQSAGTLHFKFVMVEAKLREKNT